MATTTNYAWETPDDTDLVKDGAAAIRTLGSSIDTTTKALNPSTTLGDIEYRSSTANTNTRLGIGTAGQVLTVSGGVPSWATPTDQTPLTTKGDLFTFNTADARLGVGANGTVLTADSAEATGLKWATPSSGSSFVGASIRNDSGISVDSSTTTTMPFPQETFDTNGFHDNTTNNSRFTVPSGKAGYYQINYTVLYQGYSSNHAVRLVYFVNGTQICLYKAASVAGIGEQNYFFSRTVNLAVGDYVELKVWQDSGVARNFYVDGNQGQAVMTYLGA